MIAPQIRTCLTLSGIVFFIAAPIFAYYHGRISPVAFGIILVVGVILTLFYATKVASSIAEPYLTPANMNPAEAWH
jgi:hypothetical protein